MGRRSRLNNFDNLQCSDRPALTAGFTMNENCLSRRPSLAPLVCSAVAVALLNSVPTHAETQASATAAPSTTLTEVVVTAEKRKSTIQETAISITAMSSDEMQQKGISSVEQIVQAVPGVSMRSSGPGQTEIEMRGIAASGGSAPTVGFYLDDYPLPPSVSSLLGKSVVSPDMYDLSRAEVLRGPQGTLWGSGSMGGTVRMITNAPQLNQFSGTGEVDGSYTNGGNVPNGKANLELNIPLVQDFAALRVVLSDKYNSGWISEIIENPFPMENNNGCTPNPSFVGCNRGDVLTGHVVKDNKDVNWEHTSGGRAELLVQPTENLKILTMAMVQYTFQGGENTADDPPGLSYEAHYAPADVREPYSDKWQLYGNTITYDFHFAQLTAATSYFNRTSINYQDTSEADQNFYLQPAYFTQTDQFNYNKNPTHQFSEEVRLASEGDGRLNWIGGLYYNNLYNSLITGVVTPELCALSTGGCAANPQGIQFYGVEPYYLNSAAVFGQVSYKILPKLTATLGLRQYDFRVYQQYAEQGFFAPTGNANVYRFSNHEKATGDTPKVGLSYQPNKNLNLYGSFSEGIRPGGNNVPVPVQGAVNCLSSLQLLGINTSPLSYGPDKVDSYELGEKALLNDGRLRIDGDVFYNRWNNVQALILLQCGDNYTGNPGNAKTYGPELEMAFKATPNWTFEASGSFVRAYFFSVVPNTGLQPGQPVLNVPKYDESTSVSYEKSIGSDVDVRGEVTNMYIGPTVDEAFSYVNLEPYDLVNARVAIDRGAFSYSLYVNNLTDKRAEISSNNTILTVSMPDLIRFTTNQPRTIGFNVSTSF